MRDGEVGPRFSFAMMTEPECRTSLAFAFTVSRQASPRSRAARKCQYESLSNTYIIMEKLRMDHNESIIAAG